VAFDTILTRLGDKLATISGMKGVYGPDSGTAARVMPQSVDDWPVAIVWPDGGELQPGNGPEPFLHRPEARIWVNATSADYAFATAYSFLEPARVLFRGGITLDGACTRCIFLGYSPLELDEAHGKPFFVLPLLFEVLEHTATTAYTA
jgi:hypothetical protein